jgi:hypothetical protein
MRASALLSVACKKLKQTPSVNFGAFSRLHQCPITVTPPVQFLSAKRRLSSMAAQSTHDDATPATPDAPFASRLPGVLSFNQVRGPLAAWGG